MTFGMLIKLVTAMLLCAVAVGCEPVVTVTTAPKPGQGEAVARILAMYGAEGSPDIAWAEGWQLTCDNGTGFVDSRSGTTECLAGTTDQNNRQVWVAWPPSATHVRDVGWALAHELRHWAMPAEVHEDATFVLNVGAAAAMVAAMPGDGQ